MGGAGRAGADPHTSCTLGCECTIFNKKSHRIRGEGNTVTGWPIQIYPFIVGCILQGMGKFEWTTLYKEQINKGRGI